MADTTLSRSSIDALRNILNDHRKDFRDDFEKIVSQISKGTGAVGNHGYGVRGMADPKKQSAELTRMIKMMEKVGKSLSVYEKYQLDAARRHKKELDKEIQALQAASKAQDQNTDAVEGNTGAHQDNSAQIKQATGRTKDFVKGLVEGKLYLDGLNKAVNELKTSYKLGFKWDPITDAFKGAMMGMDPQAMMEFQAQFRRTSGAMESGIEGFNKVVAENQFEMMKYTGSLQAAAQAMGNMYELSHNMGLNLGDVAGSANMLFNEFKRMQSVTSITIDQFVEMNQRMLANSDIQSKLLRLNKDQRAQYIQGLNQQQLYLQMMGLQKEVAEQLITATENMSSKKGLDRYQDMVKTMVGLRAMGVDEATAKRVAQLKNKTNKTDEEAAWFHEQMMSLSERYEQQKSQGYSIGGVTTNREIINDAIAENTGLLELFEAGKAGALQQSAKTTEGAMRKQQLELQQRDSDMLQVIGARMVQISDILQGWSGTAAAVLAGAVAMTILNRPGVTKAMEKVFGKILGGSGSPAAGGPGGARGPGGASGGLGKWFTKPGMGGVLKGVGAGAVVGVGASLLADQLLNPADYDPSNRQMVGAANGALSWGATGAGLGMMFGPGGAIIGGIGGAILGAGASLIQYSKDTTTHMEESLEIGNNIASAQKLKLQTEKEALLFQIETIKAGGALTEKQMQKVTELAARVDGLNANMKVEDVKQSVAGMGVASRYLSEIANKKLDFDDTEDFGKNADQLDFMMQTAGLKGSAREMLMANVRQEMLKGNIKDQDWASMASISKALKDGDEADIPANLRKYFQAGMATTADQLHRQVGANLGTIVHNQSGTTLSDTLTSQQSDYNNAKGEVQKLQAELDKMRNDPFTVGLRGEGRMMIAAKERELEEAKERMKHAADTARTLMSAANDDGSLAVAFTDDNMKTFAKELGIAIKQKTKTNSGLKSAGGLTT